MPWLTTPGAAAFSVFFTFGDAPMAAMCAPLQGVQWCLANSLQCKCRCMLVLMELKLTMANYCPSLILQMES